MVKLRWTLAALAVLGGSAAADSPQPAAMATESLAVQGGHRGVAHDYLVKPRGGELTAQMRFITAQSMLDGDRLRFTDLAMFGLSGRWSLFSKLELGASVDFLPKQPSTTDEKTWQSVGMLVRSPLGKNVALQVSGGGGHLMNHSGKWMREALTIEWKKQIDEEWLAFDIQGGVSGLGLDAPNTTSNAFITELTINTTALFHTPKGHWGGWLGIGYAVPVQASGRNPVTEMVIDPQPRLSFHTGTVLSLVPKWDLYVDFAVVDRGDLGNPATTLPILDGGFDQTQIIFGVTRHIEGKKDRRDDSWNQGDSVRLGAL